MVLQLFELFAKFDKLTLPPAPFSKQVKDPACGEKEGLKRDEFLSRG